MVQNREPFLSRWSRRKRAAEESHAAIEPKPPAQSEAPLPELPPVDSLTPESDFSVFMHKQVDEKLRRAALRKLFSDPAFNVVDGLDDYADDYTQLETLAAGAAAGLEHAKSTLFGGDPDAQPPAPDETAERATADATAAEEDDGAAVQNAQEPEATDAVGLDPGSDPDSDSPAIPPLADASEPKTR